MHEKKVERTESVWGEKLKVCEKERETTESVRKQRQTSKSVWKKSGDNRKGVRKRWR